MELSPLKKLLVGTPHVKLSPSFGLRSGPYLGSNKGQLSNSQPIFMDSVHRMSSR